MTDCTYRSWPSVTEPYAVRTYEDVLQETATKFSHTLRNDLDFFTNEAHTPDPFSGGQYKFSRSIHLVPGEATPRELLTQWIERKQTVRPAEAVIAIIGNSATPEGWFSDDPVSQSIPVVPYMNYAGTGMLALGFDVYAPFQTHVGLFQTYQARLANSYGMQGGEIDTQRVIEVFKYVAAQGYTKIHLVGTSGGGVRVALVSRELAGHPQLGMGLSVSGFYVSATYVMNNRAGLYALPWGATFGWGGTLRSFLCPPVNVYFAMGSCDEPYYGESYRRLPKSRVKFFDGAHEFRMEEFNWALAQYRLDFGVAASPPPAPPSPPGNHAPVVTVTSSYTNAAGNQSGWKRGDQLPISVSDADGDAITMYRFTSAASARMWFDGSTLAQNTTLDLMPSQLTGFWIGPGMVIGTDIIRVQVYDGAAWSAPADITINSV